MELRTTSNTSTEKTLFSEEETLNNNIEKVKDSIPDHLKEFIVEQDTTDYQPLDHAVWRYSLRQLKNFLSKNAHSCYLDGLEKTGITVESIPNIEQICKKLQEFGWAAVPVSGFIPPAAFMELQSLGILPIATDMRTVDHILYTPAPDIVHEAAGHAPILINEDFAKYLKEYAQVAKNAIVSSEDLALYEAIRDLSDIKEHPESTPEDIHKANEKLERIAANMSVTSEATLLGRMNWWTAEYGLIGDINDPKIYGAGLLSSYGEAKECLKDHVKKIPLSLDCIKYNYDITEPQPQLFVAKSFEDLKRVLHELSLELSYKKGGLFGLKKAIEAKTVNTVQLNSGLQISGKVVDYIERDGECVYFRLEGPSQLSVGGKQLEGHGKDFHSHGFSSPLGYVEGYEDCLSWAGNDDLKKLGLIEGQEVDLRFENGVHVSGRFIDQRRTPRGELCLLSFNDCHVSLAGKVLFMPEWGTFDMAVGSKVESVFSGPADRKNYGLTDSFIKKKVPPKKRSEKVVELNSLYQQVRELRANSQLEVGPLTTLYKTFCEKFPGDWLAVLELIEITYKMEGADSLRDEMTKYLKEIKTQSPEKSTVIDDGLALANRDL